MLPHITCLTLLHTLPGSKQTTLSTKAETQGNDCRSDTVPMYCRLAQHNTRLSGGVLHNTGMGVFGCVCEDVLCGNGSVGAVSGTWCQYVPETVAEGKFMKTSVSMRLHLSWLVSWCAGGDLHGSGLCTQHTQPYY